MPASGAVTASAMASDGRRSAGAFAAEAAATTIQGQGYPDAYPREVQP